MPMSQGNFSNGPVGLQLKAWALFNSAGVCVKSEGCTGSGGGTGVTLTFTTAMANTNYLVDTSLNAMGKTADYSGVYEFTVSGKTTASVSVKPHLDANPTSGLMPDMLHVAVYA